LRAYAWLIFGISALAVLYELTSRRIDEYRFDEYCSIMCQSGIPTEYGIVLVLITLVVAYALFPIEHDESTIDFLHALPVSRSCIYLAKVLAGFILLSSLFILDHVISLVLLATNPQSIDGRFYPEFFFKQVFIELVFVFVVLSYGVVLSWFRWFGLVVCFLYFVILVSLELKFGDVGLISIMSVLQIDISGQSMKLVWKNILVHLGISIVVLYVGYFLWSRDHRVKDMHSQPKSRRWVMLIGGVILYLSASAALIFEARQIDQSINNQKLMTVSTEHYRFVAPSSSFETLSKLRRYADQDYRELVTLLDTKHNPTIQADLTSKSVHALGVANWTKIFMNIAGGESIREYRRILSHETVHTFQAIESERKLSKHYGSTKFFIEGMAQFASFHIVSNEPLRASNWELAAIAKKYLDIEFDDIVNFNDFVTRFDEDLVYSLGDVWTEALVEICSRTILGDILRIVGREGAALTRTGRAWWSYVLTDAGCELNDVIDHWNTMLDDLSTSVDQRLFPTFSSPTITRDDTSRRLRMKVNLTAKQGLIVPDSFILRVRSQAKLSDIPDSVFFGKADLQRESAIANSGNSISLSFVLPVAAQEQGALNYQLGYVPKDGERAFFERWRRASVEAL